MLRVGASKQAHGRNVCNLCHRTLPRSTAQQSCRSPISHSSRSSRTHLSPASNEALSNLLGGVGAAPIGIRFFTTTTATLSKFGSFGSIGSSGGLGSFGASKDPAKPSSDGLLPHERSARQKFEPPPAPTPPPAPQPRRPLQQDQGASQDARQQHRHGVNNLKPKRQRSPDHHARAERSRNMLGEIFGRKQAVPVPHPARRDSHARPLEKRAGQADLPDWGAAPESAPAKPAASKWGAFSSRTSTTNTTSADRAASGLQPKPKAEASPDGHGAPFVVAKGEDAWEAMRTGRRGDETELSKGRAAGNKKKTGRTGDDFWSGMESRVSDIQAQAAAAPPPPQPIEEEVILPAREHKQPKRQDQTRRKTRFEMDQEHMDQRARKSKNKKQKHHSRGHEQDQGDYEDDFDWEAHELRQEEKRQRKQREAEEAAAVPIFLPEYINVSNLAQSLKQQVNSFLNDLEEMGFENMTNDTILTGETAALIAMEYGFEPTVDTGSKRDLLPRPVPEDPSSLPSRPPIVTIMGHVDHGKTTLLDYLRKSSVAAQEHGGITQHIGAFVVKMSSGKPITFLDTPGHAAFLTMRQRGANVTDIVVLVVAADDSVKPQTLEALKHAQAAKVPIIVAINKIDKEEARVDVVKADLSRHGVEIEDFGGDVQVVCVSGKTGKGMDDLEENIITLSEMLDVRAEEDGMAEGWILESSVKQDGKAATVLVKRGTLRTGDFIAAGQTWARIRFLRNEAGAEITEAAPGTPVEILGWRELPDAGELVLQAPDEDKAKTATEYRQEMAERQQSSVYIAEQEQRQREKEAAEAAAAEAEARGEDPAAAAAAEASAAQGIIYQNYTVKADVAGSVEAVCSTIMELGNNKVQARILRSAAGQISESDVDHAAVSGSIIVNFNLPIPPHVKALAQKAGVEIRDQSVIYHVVDDVKSTLSDLLPVKITHRVLGEADVLQIFPINVKKRVYRNIAGCRIRNGSVKKTSRVKVLRRGKVIFDGAIDTLKHVKKDVMEMSKGTECGIGFEGFEDMEMDDQIQTYEIIEEKRTL